MLTAWTILSATRDVGPVDELTSLELVAVENTTEMVSMLASIHRLVNGGRDRTHKRGLRKKGTVRGKRS